MTKKSMALVEVDYKLVPKMGFCRTRTQRRFKSKRPIRKTALMVIDSSGLSKEAVETTLKRILHRQLLKNSIKLVAYRTVEREDSSGSQNSAT